MALPLSYPELVHPHAPAMNMPLLKPTEHIRILLGSAALWVEVPTGENEKFLKY